MARAVTAPGEVHAVICPGAAVAHNIFVTSYFDM